MYLLVTCPFVYFQQHPCSASDHIAENSEPKFRKKKKKKKKKKNWAAKGDLSQSYPQSKGVEQRFMPARGDEHFQVLR